MTRPLRRLAFRVEYDGTGFHGWQKQPNSQPTIQESLEHAIAEVVGAEVRVEGASRTDAGVHALDQLAAVNIRHPIRPEGLVKASNRRLPAAIAIRDAQPVPDDFRPRFANRGKVYRYRLYTGRIRRPLRDRFAWRMHWNIDPTVMLTAAEHLVGTHDFACFAASDGSHKTTVRTINAVRIAPDTEGVLEIRVEGTAFLKHMVRNIVGTLVEIGRGKRSANSMLSVIEGRDRRLAGPTAPASGLCLERMLVDQAAFEPRAETAMNQESG